MNRRRPFYDASTRFPATDLMAPTEPVRQRLPRTDPERVLFTLNKATCIRYDMTTDGVSESSTHQRAWGRCYYGPFVFHNASELEPVVCPGGKKGVRPQRVPESLRACLSPVGRDRMLEPAGVELRWMAEDLREPVRLVLSAPDRERPVEVVAYYGDFRGRTRFMVGEEPSEHILAPNARFRDLPFAELSQPDQIFPPNLVRLVFSGGPVVLHEYSGEGLRRPQPSDLPALMYLAYGTSITQGAVASGQHLSYASLLARAMKADLFNLGSSGSCFCEPEMADHLSGCRYDFATLSLSVNMIGAFTEREFRKRVTYLAGVLAEKNPGRPLLCISILPWYGEWVGSAKERDRSARFRSILREVVDALPDCVRYVDGPDLMSGRSGLSDDLLHPSDHGMIEIAQNLALHMAKLQTHTSG